MADLGQHLLIDGELIGPEDRKTHPNINPANEEVIGVTPEAEATDIERAIGAARRAFDTTDWSTNVELRLRVLRQLQEALQANVEEIRSIVIAEGGSPVAITPMVQVDGPISYIDHWIDLLGTYEFEKRLETKSIMGVPSDRVIRREAVGVVAAVTPWNYPFYLAICKVTAALAAGCTVILKPAPDTPWSALAIGELITRHTDIPAGVLNVVATSDNQLAGMLVAHPDVDAVTLTGSTGTGRKVMEAAAATLKQVTLELGGKSPAVMLPGADFAQIVPALAMGLCSHAGQGCAALTRLVVPQDRYEETIEIAAAAMKAVTWGDPTEPTNIMGPVVNASQRDRILGYIESARRDGGRIVVGGGTGDRFEKGYYIEPTLIADVSPKSAVAQEEIFGPVLVVLPYADEAEALEIANGTEYGLSGAVFGADHEQALAFARRLRSGTVGINGGAWFDPSSPFGGYKQSGLGREWGTEGLEDFLEVKTMAVPQGAGF